jgi:hypothetical protein
MNNNVTLHQEVNFLLKTKETVIPINCTEKIPLSTEGDSDVVYHNLQHSLQLECKDLPEDMEFQDERETVTEAVVEGEPASEITKKSPVLKLKVHLDLFEALLESKEAEYGQVMQQLEVMRSKVKEVSKKQTTAGSTPKEKKTKKRNVQFNEEESTEVTKTDGILGKMLPILFNNAAIVAAMAVEHRAVLMFGISTLGIYLFGEHASI